MADIKINGVTPTAIYVGSTPASAVYLGNVKVWESAPVDPYNPLGLPAYTIRLKFTDGVTPTFSKGTAVQVSSSPNVWDLTYNNTDWTDLTSQLSMIEVLGANSTGVMNMTGMFYSCQSLTTVPLFDTSNVSDMNSMFGGCMALTTIPLFNVSSATDMGNMFYYCTNVQSGALALYQQASALNPPPTHSFTFNNCGSNTVTGAAELAQIPSDWK